MSNENFPKWFLAWVNDLKREELYELIYNRMSDEDKEEEQHRYEEEQSESESESESESDDDEEKEVWLKYDEFLEYFEPKYNYDKYKEDDSILIQTRPHNSGKTSTYWCSFEWRLPHMTKWNVVRYTGSSAFAMWWCQVSD